MVYEKLMSSLLNTLPFIFVSDNRLLRKSSSSVVIPINVYSNRGRFYVVRGSAVLKSNIKMETKNRRDFSSLRFK